MFRQNPAVSNYTRPKKRFLKGILLGLILIVLGTGLWVGVAALSSLKKITGAEGNGSFLSFLGDFSKDTLKGQAEGRTNILLLGMGGKKHPGGMLSDTIIVVSINWSDKKIALMSLPRDLWVNIPNYGNAKINEAYAYGEQNSKITGGGGKVAGDVVGKVLDIPIHYFVSVDFDGFKKMVDTVGGVDIYVEKDIYDPYYPAANMIDYDPFKISAGLRHMDGALALKYARSRKTTSDFDRSKRQEQVLVAVKEKTMTLGTLGNPKKVTELLGILGEHIRTNLAVGEIKTLWEQIKDFDTEHLINKVFDTASDGPLTSTQDERGYIVIPRKGLNNFTDLQKIAKNIFNQETAEAANRQLKIEVLNGTNKSGVASQVSQLLKSYGYNVTKVGDATQKYDNSTIYNCSTKDAEQTAKDLADTLKAEVKTKTYCQNIDIQIIIGQNNL